MIFMFKDEFLTEDRGEFENYILTKQPVVARDVMFLGIRYNLAEDDPLTELILKIMNGEFIDMCEGDLMQDGMDAIITDMTEFGGNLDEDYSFEGIRVE